MKKIISIAFSAVMLFSMASCTKDNSVKEKQQAEERTIIAVFERNETKTTLGSDSATPLWEVGNTIRILDGSYYEDITLVAENITESGRKVTFTTTLTGPTLYAVYPATATSQESCVDGDITFTIPEVQDGSFASANICVAKGSVDEEDKIHLIFSNATAVLEFSQTAATTKVLSIRVEAANNIAGELTASFGADNKVNSVALSSTGASRIIRTSVVEDPITKYYVAIAPVETGAANLEYQQNVKVAYVPKTTKTLEKNVIYYFSMDVAETEYKIQTGTIGTTKYVQFGNLKWATRNLFISPSGNKEWKGAGSSTLKTPLTNENVNIGDFFQWAAYEGYAEPVKDFGSGATDKGLLLYDSFNSEKCGDANGTITFKTKPGTSYKYLFDDDDYGTGYVCISPYMINGGSSSYSYTKYTENGILDDLDDDTAHTILGDTWRMPTADEFILLASLTHWKWDDTSLGYYVYLPQNDTDAGQFTSLGVNMFPNSTGTYNTANALLFFPASGYAHHNNSLGGITSYNSSYLVRDYQEDMAFTLDFNKSSGVYIYGTYRSEGITIRPVSE